MSAAADHFAHPSALTSLVPPPLLCSSRRRQQQQVDAPLLDRVAEELCVRFAELGITKVRGLPTVVLVVWYARKEGGCAHPSSLR